MNSKDNYKLSKDMNGAERLGTAIGAGIATVYCKCLNASDRAVIDRMRRDGYSNYDINYYLKYGETPQEAQRKEQRRRELIKEQREKKNKKGGFFSRLFGKKEEPKKEEPTNTIKINGYSSNISYSINE